MKTAALSFAALSLLQLAAAQPRHRRHADMHDKRAIVTVVQTAVVQATAAPQVIVYVDQFGHAVRTVTQTFLPAPAPSTTSTTTSTTSTSTTSTTTSTTSTTSTTAAPATVVQAEAHKQGSSNNLLGGVLGAVSSVVAPVASAVAAVVPAANGFGVAYNAYNSDGTCKTQGQVDTDFAQLGAYGLVRNYGTDCNQPATMLAACRRTGKKLFQGIFSLSDIEGQVATIVAAAGGDWSAYHTVSVGNELVNGGQADPATVLGAVAKARSLLRAAGYAGPVVTVDTLVATQAHPELCDGSDYCAVNCHPFFDSTVAAATAGPYIQSAVAGLRGRLANPSQKIIVTETGWPHKGDANGQAVPNAINQGLAITSIEGAFASNPSDVILLSAFNMLYKTSNAAQFDAEPYWGILGNCPSG